VKRAVDEALERARARFEEERQQLMAERDAAVREKQEAQLAAAPSRSDEVDALQIERGRLMERITELEGQVKELQARPVEAAAPAAAPPPAGDSDAVLSDWKSQASDVYEGMNEALSGLRRAIVQAQDTFERIERAIADREAAQQLGAAIDQSMELYEDAKGQIKSLRSLID
jgi:chromosome segregation ATPase